MIFIPLMILGLVGTAGVVQHKRSKLAANPQLQAERQVIYETALNTVKDPAKLRSLSDAFKEVGLIAESDMLKKRAALQELPADIKEKRRVAFRQAMSSTDSAYVLKLADAYYSEGCTGAAEQLRKYAAGLKAAEVKSDEQA